MKLKTEDGIGLSVVNTRRSNISNNPSTPIALNGVVKTFINANSTTQGETNNPAKPFATMQAAIDALPINQEKLHIIWQEYDVLLSIVENLDTKNLKELEISFLKNKYVLIGGNLFTNTSTSTLQKIIINDLIAVCNSAPFSWTKNELKLIINNSILNSYPFEILSNANKIQINNSYIEGIALDFNGGAMGTVDFFNSSCSVLSGVITVNFNSTSINQLTVDANLLYDVSIYS